VEAWLADLDIDLARVPGCGILVQAPEQERRRLAAQARKLPATVAMTREQRLRTTILHLLVEPKPLLAKQLAGLLGVSRTTVLKDMDAVEAWLRQRKLSLIKRPHYGFRAVGEENHWREAVVESILATVGPTCIVAWSRGARPDTQPQLESEKALQHLVRDYLAGLRLKLGGALLDGMTGMLRIRVAEDARASLILHLSVMLQRLPQGNCVTLRAEHVQLAKTRKEFAAAETVADQLLRTSGLVLPESEVAHIAIQLASAEPCPSAPSIGFSADTQSIEPDVLQMVEGILAEASVRLHPYLRLDRRLTHGLALHLGPALMRVSICQSGTPCSTRFEASIPTSSR
jgi:transcriptional antiterminator